MTIGLAAISWVDHDPIGVRLRWRFPAELLGLPGHLVIQRAPVREWDQSRGKSVTAVIPQHWWEFVGDVHLYGVPVLDHHFATPVDGLRYTQRRAARVLAFDETARLVDDRTVADGETVEIARPRIRTLRFLAFDVTLQNLEVLDLDAERGLDWTKIARISVAGALHGPFADVESRLPSNPLDEARWTDVRKLVQHAEGDPGSWPAGEPTPWQALDVVLGMRWAHAVVAGSGFVDGPGHSSATVDDVDRDAVLEGPPTTAYAYRVTELDPEGRPGQRSTVAVVPPGTAPPLATPLAPSYGGATVRLREDGAYEATATASWSQTDPMALGVVLEERTSASPSTGAPATVDQVESRSRRPEDPPSAGSLVRVRNVPAHDVTLGARATALDGWDRQSTTSAWGPPATLQLVHNPTPPLLRSGRWSGGTTLLDLTPPAPGAPPWSADPLVTSTGGDVVVCRRTRDPVRAAVTTGAAVPLNDELLDVPVSGVPAGVSFTGGRLLAGGRSVAVVAQRPGFLTLAVPAGGGGTALGLPPGAGILIEDAMASAAWIEVHAVPATAVPAQLVFTEPHPLPPSGADVCVYALRVRFLGRRGPLGTAVAVSRLITSPPAPPPFTVGLLDVDHLRRTLVEIELTTPASGEHVVAWAPGTMAGAEFAVSAAEGDLGPIAPHDGRLLHDVLSLPIPRSVAERVTIGVAKLGPAGTRSPYTTVQVTVPAPP